MKILSKNRFVLVASMAFLNVCAAAPDFEMKGLRIGMTEAQFKAANKGAQCDKALRTPKLDKAIPPLPALRTCSVPNYTLADKRAKSTQFVFYNDQLGHIFHSFYTEDARALQAALAEKYGTPKSNPGRNTVEWEFANSASLRLIREPGDTAYLYMDSQPSLDYLMQSKAVERKQAQKDL